MKKLNLDAIEKRARRAPKGPWVLWKGTAIVMIGPASLNEPGRFTGPKGGGQICEVDDFENPKAKSTARFIAHSRRDVPALCAAVRERDATIARLTADVSALRELAENAWANIESGSPGNAALVLSLARKVGR